MVDKEVVMIGDTVVDKDSISPSHYFNYVKGMKDKVDFAEYQTIIDTTLKMIEKTKITGQTAMAKELASQLELSLKELDAAKKGFDVFVPRTEIEKYISKVESKCIKIIELSRYTREIPDDVTEKLMVAKEIFDEIYIIFTDYTLKDTKKVAKERREKDPIMFGAFKNTDDDEHIYVEDRLFFIADWIEDNCDLTLEEIIRSYRKTDKNDITYQVSFPKTEKEAKQVLESFKTSVVDSKLTPKKLLRRFSRKKKKEDDKS